MRSAAKASPKRTPGSAQAAGSLDVLGRELASAIEGEVRLGLHDRMLYSTDASLYQVEPLAVVIPASVEDAARAVRFCGAHRLPVLPRGGGTSLAGQCANRAVVVDLSPNCRQLLSVDEASRTCRVEPGITVDELNALLRPTDLCFAPDPATSRHATIGGCIGNNAAGSHSIKYGRTVESLAGLDVVLADGSRVELCEGAAARDATVRGLTQRVAHVVHRHAALIQERFPKTVRRNAGFALDLMLQQLDASGPEHERVNLAHLICGSEGSLATTLGAHLRLHPIPRAKGLAIVAFDDLDAAIEAVGPILKTRPAAVELLDDNVIDLAAANREYQRYVDLMPSPASGRPLRAVLYVEYYADEDSGEIEEQFAAITGRFGNKAVGLYRDGPAMAQAWKLRKAGEPLLHGIPGDRKPITFVEDNAVPPERLAEFVRSFRAIVERHGTRAAFYAHASVGVLHVRPLLDIHDAEDRERFRAIAIEVADLARELGGVMSGEHGDGRVRSPLLERHFGRELVQAFREIKAIFDPHGLMNPGNIVPEGPAPKPIESITERLRVRPEDADVAIAPPDTFFEYEDQHGFASAVEMCNGSGVCRKKSGGVMCPSYMATLDERHSTRGRGNALRLAISGQLSNGAAPAGDADWNDQETLATLNLCLSCKACKSECPSNVDIARLKAEYLAQRNRVHGIPFAAKLFGRVHAANRLASVAPTLANRVQGSGLMRAWLRRVAGVDRRRELPRWTKPLHKRWARDPHDVAADAPVVVLLADTFTTHQEPEIGLATRRALEAFGYRVRLVSVSDLGRALISMGLLEEAITDADRWLERLRPMIDDDSVRAFIVCEPSCLSSICDDWLQLKLKAPIERRQALADKAFLPEQFLDRYWGEHPRRPSVSLPAGPLVFHGHCHQKALWGSDDGAALLRRLAGERVRVLDSGCCGMAGSFGYTEDRYDLSMRIGELSLFPSVRAAGEEATIIAPGTSCRHQIADGVARKALHPIQALRFDPAAEL
ncbi:MAG: FAD-linked oxidase C-terminal domain-containing protein [Planctomycetota bacterium]